MADKKIVEAITSMEEDFAQWYTDIVKKADLIDYTSVKGCMVFKPAGYAIWELIQRQLDDRFKATGVENVYLASMREVPHGEVQPDRPEAIALDQKFIEVLMRFISIIQQDCCIAY